MTALVLTRAELDRVRRSAPEVDDCVMELMARRIDRLSHRVAEAHHAPVQQRAHVALTDRVALGRGRGSAPDR